MGFPHKIKGTFLGVHIIGLHYVGVYIGIPLLREATRRGSYYGKGYTRSLDDGSCSYQSSTGKNDIPEPDRHTRILMPFVTFTTVPTRITPDIKSYVRISVIPSGGIVVGMIFNFGVRT